VQLTALAQPDVLEHVSESITTGNAGKVHSRMLPNAPNTDAVVCGTPSTLARALAPLGRASHAVQDPRPRAVLTNAPSDVDCRSSVFVSDTHFRDPLWQVTKREAQLFDTAMERLHRMGEEAAKVRGCHVRSMPNLQSNALRRQAVCNKTAFFCASILMCLF